MILIFASSTSRHRKTICVQDTNRNNGDLSPIATSLAFTISILTILSANKYLHLVYLALILASSKASRSRLIYWVAKRKIKVVIIAAQIILAKKP